MVSVGQVWHSALPTFLRHKSLPPTKETHAPKTPSEKEMATWEKLNKAWKKCRVLHSPSTSWHSLAWTHIVEKMLNEKGQVLILCPEIEQVKTLLSQLTTPLARGHHSQLTPKEQAQTWLNCANHETLCIVGTKSAVLLPFSRLRYLIVCDEQHIEWKERERNFRYQARDAALMLASQHQSRTLLTSQFLSSAETFYNTQQKKFLPIALPTNPHTDKNMPTAQIVRPQSRTKKK